MGTTSKFSFLAKAGFAALLAALADWLFYGHGAGWTLGAFDLALVATVLAVHRSARRDPRAGCALGGATIFAVLQIGEPTVLNAALCWSFLAVAVLSARVAAGESVPRWCVRVAYLAAAGLIAPARDLLLLCGKVAQRRPWRTPLIPVIAPPLVGGAVFVGLFALANPIIEQAVASVPVTTPDIPRIVFLAVVTTAVWTVLRPRLSTAVKSRAAKPARPVPGINATSVAVCVVTFNLLFAVENGLDLAFLWSGARLPAGVTFAGYAHRGAYALIVTALLAGAFVLLALRPGTPAGASIRLRRLVTLWVAQTLLLVASSILRTLNYVQAYSLTGFRVAALIWMVLVGVGLVLICWRLLRGRSGEWLIGANALAAGLVLAVCSGVDLDAVAASWNVSHAREAGGIGPTLDLCYLSRIGDAALVPLSEFQNRALPPALRERVVWLRSESLETLHDRQANWRRWTWRGQRRLERAEALAPLASPTGFHGPRSLVCDAAAAD